MKRIPNKIAVAENWEANIQKEHEFIRLRVLEGFGYRVADWELI